jgi:hypothetical protein
VSEASWYIYDPDPIENFSRLTGPFPTRDEAFEYANEAHPEDGIGNAEILQAVKP